MDKPTVSLAIETSCRAGGLVLAAGAQQHRAISFDASSRHATHLISHLAEMVRQAGLKPADIDEVYVSAGPGSFTGVRVGIAAVRTMAQAMPHLRCVAVPTPMAVAENTHDLAWENLAVILDARDGWIHASLFVRQEGLIEPVDGWAGLYRPEEFLAGAPRPLLLVGEGLAFHQLSAPGVSAADPSLHLPTAEAVWRVGNRLARAGRFTEYHDLLPIYTRSPHVTTPHRK